ncbi:hypothetical protein A9P82_14675 [Arachidicoccus ginsenosidimutans]|uniref:5-oxoprolinase subunit C family protein n=1 Tax=Arachidicoccus sp. BS20 TaxID=1850526 RepID=UPI0007F17C69|nr:biotin-dependent carboxyltransferase family protein [Arachidicoccus sp. BS20]ANI90420.1 hypothetical protein A9P82_14675 [Arachidicoccus sp. BS20]
MSLKIIKAGILDTVQDTGRLRYRHLGINPGGAMDAFAARIANILVNNNADDAVLEMHFPASQILFQKPAIIVLSGANFSPKLNGKTVASYQPIFVNVGDKLVFERCISGARLYLAVYGGFKTDKWLNSYSTNLKLNCGGHFGRSLKKDDVLEYGKTLSEKIINAVEKITWKAAIIQENDDEILVLKGNEWEQLNDESKALFENNYFEITAKSDRMGYRLLGQSLSRKQNTEMLSSAVNFGTIQLLPNGQLIVLMADHQTTGGYPRVAHVISAHRNKLAQYSAGKKIKFIFTTQAVAEAKAMEQRRFLEQLKTACALKWNEI